MPVTSCVHLIRVRVQTIISAPLCVTHSLLICLKVVIVPWLAKQRHAHACASHVCKCLFYNFDHVILAKDLIDVAFFVSMRVLSL